MITFEARNFRGCERADIECAPVALVAGRNGAGKSSLAQAAAAVLCGDPLPIAGVTKAQAGMLVKAGANTARITVMNTRPAGSTAGEGESGTARIEWPGCQPTSDGTPPAASKWAAGIDSVALLPPRERAAVLAEYLKADPTREDLAAALADVELGDKAAVDTVWKLVTDHGWDGAHTLCREKGAELKGRWRQVTGANYGSRVARTWRPSDWEDDLDDAVENDLAAAIGVAKAAADKAIAQAAISGAARTALEAEAADVEPRKDALQQAEAEAERIDAELTAAKTERAGLPPATVDSGMACPHCGGFVVVRQVNLAETKLEAAEVAAVGPAEVKKRRLAIADADGRISNLGAALREADRAVDLARNAMQIGLDARRRVEAMPPAETASGADVVKAAAAHQRAIRRWEAFRQKTQADELQRRIAGNDLVLGVLAADGLRGQKLGHVLDLFNTAQLGRLSLAAGWSPVIVDAEMTLAYGGRPYALLSTSEQYRVRAVLQLAMAYLDGSAVVVLDAADVLDGTTRSGLFAMLEEAGLPALVCMTLTRREQVPDLAAAGLGTSYWLADGVAQALHPPAEAAA